MYEAILTKIAIGEFDTVVNNFSSVLLKYINSKNRVTPDVYVSSTDHCRELMIDFIARSIKYITSANTLLDNKSSIRYVTIKTYDGTNGEPFPDFACKWLTKFFDEVGIATVTISEDKRVVSTRVDITNYNARYIGIILSMFIYLSRYLSDVKLSPRSKKIIPLILNSRRHDSISFYTAWFYWLLQRGYSSYCSDVNWENGPAQLGERLIPRYVREFTLFLKEYKEAWEKIDYPSPSYGLIAFVMNNYLSLLETPFFELGGY